MADLIDRQKIKARFEPWLKVQGYSEGELNMLKAVLYEITIMPSAERHGHWNAVEDWDDVHYQCSECGAEFVLIDGTPQDNDYLYCPSCGAKMDGEQE